MSEFELPYPTTLTDDEVRLVLSHLEANAATAVAAIKDERTNYQAALAASLVEFMRQRIAARGQGGSHFDDIEPEDFGS